MGKSELRKIIISRTDAIGDVVLTLPMAAWIKQNISEKIKIVFLGRTYTEPVIKLSTAVDEFLNYDEFAAANEEGREEFLRNIKADAILHIFPRKEIARAAKAAGIAVRVGTSHRLFHWLYCNRLVGVGRKNSPLHEAQLNFELLKGLGITASPAINEIGRLYHFANVPSPVNSFSRNDDDHRFHLIIHPKSNASGREWKLENYSALLKLLPEQNFRFVITGGQSEARVLNEWMERLPVAVTNLCGKLTLEELISVISSCDGLIASGTGPLHLAAALQKHVLGIFPPIRPIHPGRWAPLGTKAEYLVYPKQCSACRSRPAECICINLISPQQAANHILTWIEP